MSDVRSQVIAEFLEVFLEDDQLWAAGGAAEVQAVLEANIDDRGRLNGKVVLGFFTSGGVPASAARAAMDRFVTKRRASLSAVKPGGAAQASTPPRAAEASRASAVVPRASAVPTPATAVAKPVAPSRPRAGGIGVVSARAAEERSGHAMRAPAAVRASESAAPLPADPTLPDLTPLPSAGRPPGTLPWGNAGSAAAEPTQVHDARSDLDADATQVGEDQSAPSIPPGPARAGARRPSSSLRGVPAGEVSSPRATAPPGPVALDPSALTEITDPSREAPRKRSATEIRGAPIAASAAVSTSGPAAVAPAGPPSAFASSPPSALAAAKKKKPAKAGEAVLKGDLADALGITKRKEEAKEQKRQEAIKSDHTLGRQANNPEEDKGPVHPGVIIAAVSVVLAIGGVVLEGQPAPKDVVYAAPAGTFPCEATFTTSKELFCLVPAAALEGADDALSKQHELSQAAARQAGFEGLWLYNADTRRVWTPKASLLPLPALPRAAAAESNAASDEGGAKPSDDVDDVLEALKPVASDPAAVEDEPRAAEGSVVGSGDGEDEVTGKRGNKGKRKKAKKRKRRARKKRP